MKKAFRNPSSIRSGAQQRGFTLLELLVVITIIGILAGLMFPATSGALKRADRIHAENTAYNLKNAISAYFTEYRKYPSSESDEMTSIQSDEVLMDILLGSDQQAESGGLNPRRIAFFTSKQAKPMGDGKYRKGVTLNSGGGGALWDPWGGHYQVRMDLDYNNRVQKPDWDNTTDSQELPESILIWSTGKEENETKDNVKTW